MSIMAKIIFMFLVVGNSLGSVGTRGGGNAVVCFSDPEIPSRIRDYNSPTYGQILNDYIDKISSVEILDLYEAKLRRGFNSYTPKIIPSNPNKSVHEYIAKIQKRLNYSLVSFNEAIQRSLEKFEDANILWQPHGIQRVDDANFAGEIDTINCVVATLALQVQKNNGLYLHIDERLYNHPKHSDLSKKVTFLHEVVYQIGMRIGHADSSGTRKMVSNIISYGENYTVQKMLNIFIEQEFFELDFSVEYPSLDEKFQQLQSTYVYRQAREVVWHLVDKSIEINQGYNENLATQDFLRRVEKILSLSSGSFPSLEFAYDQMTSLKHNRNIIPKHKHSKVASLLESIKFQLKEKKVYLHRKLREYFEADFKLLVFKSFKNIPNSMTQNFYDNKLRDLVNLLEKNASNTVVSCIGSDWCEKHAFLSKEAKFVLYEKIKQAYFGDFASISLGYEVPVFDLNE